MSKQAKEFFEQIKDGNKQIGVLEAVKEGIQAIAPGLSLSKILNEVGSEMKQQAAHGAHELASALFRGDAFVMYPRTAKEGQSMEGQGLHQEGQQQEQSRGGREL